ncbi:HpcH/HpaI aldolase/citrate lyase family protein [Caminibacter pacificus]|uniref:Aldolase n=1 Tax=Caminibacter pacificus TaxID=1424653 RepID=A0AAJ4RCE6_9BACT|nr:aldolase/citrate lyase family protein [Caminibacter pacificus]QCI27926.1 aldolase [Caminibacter pacificus]ROR39896.1 citrate lyase subunit beta/citryl-CoA lyase [Caminibacter pacificus]
MIFEDISELEKIVENNDIQKALSLIKPPKKFPLAKTKKRSALMVSAHQVKHLNKIDSLPTDIIMLNLEDGVPKDKKEIARVMIGVFLSHIEKIDKEIVIRVNALDEGGKKDIEFLEKFNFNAFRIPKVRSIEDIDDVFMKTEKEIHASIETKEAFFNLKELKHPKLTTFYIGIYDLLNELKISHSVIDLNNPLIHRILSDFTLTARYLNITPIGFVYQQYKDLEGFKNWCLLQKNLGMQGVGCITPAQCQIANKIFDEDLEFAKMIVKRFESEGPFTIDGLFVDEPIYKNYLQMLDNS